MTAREAFISARDSLKNNGIAEAEAKAKVIVAHALDIDFAEVYSEKQVSEKEYKQIASMVARCAAGEPVEYVTGKAYFRHLTLDVSPGVLIPRKETELVAEKAIELIRQNAYKAAADVCTGSGCIAISIAAETGIHVAASDISGKAVEIAKKNAARAGVSGYIEIFLSDMFDSFQGSYDIIVCNPPYVSESEYSGLDDGVRLYEPPGALLAKDGLEFYRRIAKDAPRYIKGGGAMVLEIGYSQARSVKDLLEQSGFKSVECYKDYAGRDRIVCARLE